MQQGLGYGGAIEIARFAPKSEVRKKKRSSERMPAQFGVGCGQQHTRADQQRGSYHDRQRRQDALGPAYIEISYAECCARLFIENKSGDEKSADDKKHVHADETARHRRRKGMEGDDNDDRDGAQPIDIGPIIFPYVARFLRGARTRSFGCDTRQCQSTAWNASACGVTRDSSTVGMTTTRSPACLVKPPSRPTMPRTRVPRFLAS